MLLQADRSKWRAAGATLLATRLFITKVTGIATNPRSVHESGEPPRFRSTVFRWAALGLVLLAGFVARPEGAAAQSGGDSGQQSDQGGTQTNQDSGAAQGNQGSQYGPGTPMGASGRQSMQGLTSPAPLTPSVRQHTDRAGLTRDVNQLVDQPDAQGSVPQVPTSFQLLIERTTGDRLPLFGRSLFAGAAAFGPLPNLPPPTDYLVSTGDQVLVRIWGPVTMNEALTVDRAGDIYLPQVGIIHVAGLTYAALSGQIQQSAGRIFRNFNLSVNLGSLHSIQVFVTGEAARPGSYTISSLSTLVNAVFASGGPSQAGTMRAIELRRENQTVTTFDFYDLLLGGDKSKDAHLLPGDVIFIPPAGPQVAVSGQVQVPAIYELKRGETLATALRLAGGENTVASGGSISLEQIVHHAYREARQLPLTPAGLATPLEDGDLLIIGAISHRFENTVTIRGNLANPGRFAWHPGMRLSEIIPDKASLLTQDYWDFRNAEARRSPFFEPQPAAPNQGAAAAAAVEPAASGAVAAGVPINPSAARAGVSATLPSDSGAVALPSTNSAAPGRTGAAEPAPQRANRITLPAPEIDWSYAVIERTERETLRNLLIPFNLGRLVLDHDAAADLPLEPGDVVTIFSQADFQVAEGQRTKFVRIEGEVASAGVYSVHPGETLQALVARAGGLSPQAYLFGAQFTRESTRVLQQQRLEEYANRLSIDMQRSAARQATSFSQAGSLSPGADVALAVEERLLAQLREQRATGRIVLDFKLDSEGLTSIPPLALENGDVLVVPSRPAVINVIGSVSTQSSFLFEQGATVHHYLALAGGPERQSDVRHAFVIRANGAVISRQSEPFLSDKFQNLKLAPGDTLVVPAKLFTISRLRTVLDSSTAISQLALVAATLAVVH